MDTVALAFVAGLSGSVGPCAAPRYLAIVGMAGASSRGKRVRTLLAFALGVSLASVVMVESSSIVFAAVQWSQALYGVLSVVFFGSGMWSLLVSERECNHGTSPRASSGAAFLLGAACAFVPSACCTPALLGIGALGTNVGLAVNAAAGAAFSLGHLSALVAVVVGSWPIARFASDWRTRQATRTVGAGLSLALAAYYAVLS